MVRFRDEKFINRPDGDWEAPLHLYLPSPSFINQLWNTNPDSDIASTLFFINSAIDDAWCFVTYCFLRHFNREEQRCTSVKPTDFGELYQCYLHNHIPKCLEMGGEVVLVFGSDAKVAFQELLWEDSINDPKRPCIVYNSVLLDVEVVTYHNSKLSRDDSHRHTREEIRHLIIYVPEPLAVGISDASTSNMLHTTGWTTQAGASFAYAAEVIGKKLPIYADF
jgi:hypothetical protein